MSRSRRSICASRARCQCEARIARGFTFIFCSRTDTRRGKSASRYRRGRARVVLAGDGLNGFSKKSHRHRNRNNFFTIQKRVSTTARRGPPLRWIAAEPHVTLHFCPR
ncbi:hypothetical protein KCP75_00720 [Salmonella enterica subsp. enterica]|nr:hypothetical protein KCP75_00720 [Salmonella enterica subsp. enterica]